MHRYDVDAAGEGNNVPSRDNTVLSSYDALDGFS